MRKKVRKAVEQEIINMGAVVHDAQLIGRISDIKGLQNFQWKCD